MSYFEPSYFISYHFITEYKDSFLTLFYRIQQLGEVVNWSDSTLTITPRSVTESELEMLRRHVDLSPKTIKRHLSEFSRTYIYTGRMAVVPQTSWDRFEQECGDMDYKKKNRLARVWFYLLVQCWLYRDFSRSEGAMAHDLCMRTNYLVIAVNWLLEHKLIALKHGHMNFGDKTCARVYQPYSCDVPKVAQHTMWFIGHMAEFENDN